jgi:hypothetical protein
VMLNKKKYAIVITKNMYYVFAYSLFINIIKYAHSFIHKPVH